MKQYCIVVLYQNLIEVFRLKKSAKNLRVCHTQSGIVSWLVYPEGRKMKKIVVVYILGNSIMLIKDMWKREPPGAVRYSFFGGEQETHGEQWERRGNIAINLKGSVF